MLSQVQKRIERSIFEAIRKVLVTEGYIPDITDISKYPVPLDNTSQANWDADLKQIQAAKKFAIEAFGHGSSEAKGPKKVPRIAIISRRTLPGDIGSPLQGVIITDPNNAQKIVSLPLPISSSNFQIDVHLVSDTSAQDRVLNAVLSKAIGMLRWLQYEDFPEDRFFIRQYNYYDLPDAIEGIEEKVYSYEIPDVFEHAGDYTAVSKIKEITLETSLADYKAILQEDGVIIGPYITDGGLLIDLNGINFI